MQYIINANGHYFHVSPEISMMSTPFKGCLHYNSEHEMLLAVGESTGASLSELADSTLEIFKNKEGVIVCSDARGIATPIEVGFVEYVTNFEV